MSIFKNSFIYVGAEVLNKSIPFLLLPILTKYLTPTDYGYIASFGSFVAFVTMFVGLSANGALSVEFFKLSKDRLRVYIGNIFILLFITTTIILFIVYLFSKPISNRLLLNSEWLYLGVILSFAQFVTLLNLVLWIAEKRAKEYGIYQILQTILISSLSIIMVVAFKYNWKGQVIANIIGSIIFAIISLYILNIRGYLQLKYNKDYIKDLLSFGLPLIPHNLAGWISTSGDRILLISLIGASATGLFSVGYQIGMIMSVLVSSFHKVWNPYIYGYLSKDNFTLDKKIKIVKFTYLYFLALIVLVISLNIFGYYIFNFFLNKEYINSFQYVIYVLISYAFNGAYFMVVSYIFYNKKTKILSYITFSSSLIHLILSYIFINLYGAIGVGYSMVLSYMIMFFMVWYYSNKIYPMPWAFWRYKR